MRKYYQHNYKIAPGCRISSAFYTHRTRTLTTFVKKSVKMHSVAAVKQVFVVSFWNFFIYQLYTQRKIIWSHSHCHLYSECYCLPNHCYLLLFCDFTILYNGKNSQIFPSIFKRNISIILSKMTSKTTIFCKQYLFKHCLKQ